MHETCMQEKIRTLCLFCAVIASVQTCLDESKLCPQRVECGKLNENLDVTCKGKSRIRILQLEESGLGEIGEGVFHGMTNLEELRLGYNRISLLPEKLFDDLTKLRELYLYNNKIQSASINSRIFNATENLMILSLQYNRIRQIPAMAFRNLKYLSNLSLEANGIKKIDRDAFPPENRMYRLYCFNNSISDVQFLEPLARLDYLDLSDNQIETVPPEIFLNFTRLSWLFLNKNRISNLTFLAHAQHLKHLELEHNRISTAPIDMFNKLKNLEFLTLAFNKIERIRSGSFSELKNLETLDLSHNLLVMFGEVLKPLPRLRFLHINDNRLESMVVTDVTVSDITVGNNPWKCEFIKKLFAHKQISLKYKYNANVSHLSGLPCVDAFVDGAENGHVSTTPGAAQKTTGISVDVIILSVLLGSWLLFIVGLMAAVLKICSLRKKRKETFELTALKNVARSDGGYMTPVPACQNIYEEIHDISSIRQADSCRESIDSTI